MMPHSKQASFDSDLSFDLLGPMNAASPYATFAHPGVAVSSGHPSSMYGNAWKRQSLPVTNSYGSLLARSDFDDLRARRAGDRSSMNSVSNGLPDHASRSRAWNYEDQFKYRDAPIGGPRERVQRDSPVIAELRTNVIIKDEFTLVTDLSYHLASRYSRPDASIMVKVDHTVPAQMGPVNNKRNAALIQSFMADILSVPPDRGIIKFMTLYEENLAINGSTLLADIERQEKQHSIDNQGARRTMTNGSRKSMPSFRNGVPKVDEEAHAELVAVNGTMRARVVTNGAPEAPGVFELPGEIDRRRPRTVHSHSSTEGVGMPPVPGSEPMPAKAAPSFSERPKSMGGRVSSGPGPQLSAKDRLPSQRNMPQTAPLPRALSHPPRPLERQPVHSTQKPPPQMLSPQPPIQKMTSQGAPYAQIVTPDTKLKPRDSYLDGLSDVIPVLPPELDDDKAAADKSDRTANTAKRRSLAATPFPKIPPPPPVPAETTSVKSVKIGKRKSFLSAIRRGITTAH